LVTGGAGFIGSHLVRALLARGDQVRVLDDLSSGRAENIAGLEVEFVLGDIRDPQVVRHTLRDCELVFHQAAMVGVPDSMVDPLGCYASNVTGSIHVLQAAREQGVRRVVLASSAAVYGQAEGVVDESMPTLPVSPYGASKLAMEQIAQVYARGYGLETVCLRYFNAYGPRQSPDSPYAAVIPTFVRKMLRGEAPAIEGDGKQTRDFVYVEDLVQANLLAAEARDAAGQVFNVAGGRRVSIVELGETLRSLLPGIPASGHGPEREGDIRHSAADLTRAEQALGYRPRTALKEGLRKTVEWNRAA
jgi:UDP-glucose 4-epimerase